MILRVESQKNTKRMKEYSISLRKYIIVNVKSKIEIQRNKTDIALPGRFVVLTITLVEKLSQNLRVT